MKKIGILGGMSWESTAVYYELLNKKTNQRLGGFSSCKCIIVSVDFGIIEPLIREDDWNTIDKILSHEAKCIEKAGADFLIVASNTAHLCYEAILKSINIPFIHIADATGRAISRKGLKKVGLLGTRYTMEKDFYRNFIFKNFEIEVIVPDNNDRDIVNDIIFKELIKGNIIDSSKTKLINIINKLIISGAEGVILGCTEIPLLISQNDIDIPVFDTTLLHVELAMDFALGE